MRAVGILCVWGGALLWAIGLAVLQPRYESSDGLVGNNAYWMRDVRWMAVVAAIAALVLLWRGERWRTRLALLVGLAWLAVDIGLDRLEVAGWPAAAALGVVAGGLLSAAALVGGRTTREGGTLLEGTAVLEGGTRPEGPTEPARRTIREGVEAGERPGRHVLLLAASVAAAAAPLAGALESPTDTEPSLTPSALTAGVLLAVVAAACALAAAPAATVLRFRLAMATGVVGVAGVILLRALPIHSRLTVGVLFGAALLSGVAVTAWPRRTGRGLLEYAALAAGTLLGYPVLLMSTVIATGFALPIAAPLTALAGSPAVNSADEDILITLVGVVPGLVFGALFTMRAALAPAPAYRTDGAMTT